MLQITSCLLYTMPIKYKIMPKTGISLSIHKKRSILDECLESTQDKILQDTNKHKSRTSKL